MTRPRLLDLCSCQGGAAMGYHRAGFEVVGVDINPQPLYPFEHHVGDALAYIAEHGHEFDAVHGSPPCQKWVTGGLVNLEGRIDLLTPMREAMLELGKPWIIENVPGAPMRADALLCGSMFGLTLKRHRHFETSFGPVLTPQCNHRGKICGVYGHPHGKRGAWVNARGESTMLPSTLANWRSSIGADWMDAKGLAQSIPPAYTEFMGRALMHHVRDDDPPSEDDLTRDDSAPLDEDDPEIEAYRRRSC